MQERTAVFSCLGLGDGLIASVLSNNLHLNGASVTTFHPSLSALQSWFPHLSIQSFPLDLEDQITKFDRMFIFFEKSPWMQEVIALCLKKYRRQTTILNPIATANQDYPYWEEGRFNGERTFVDNLYNFSQTILGFKVLTKSNGITPREGLVHKQNNTRVLIHPTSSREGKNWPKEKYLKLEDKLKKKGYKPQFILSKEERRNWDVDETRAPLFESLDQIASHIYESGYLIGNDSGMGHLASCLGIPTLTICRSKLSSQFWRPAWSLGTVLYPSPWIPNLKGMRLRDHHWKKWISVDKVFTTFQTLHTDSDR